jgi:predicted transcriptional regulator
MQTTRHVIGGGKGVLVNFGPAVSRSNAKNASKSIDLHRASELDNSKGGMSINTTQNEKKMIDDINHINLSPIKIPRSPGIKAGDKK